jgi:hypothetical protein
MPALVRLPMHICFNTTHAFCAVTVARSAIAGEDKFLYLAREKRFHTQKCLNQMADERVPVLPFCELAVEVLIRRQRRSESAPEAAQCAVN